MLGSAPTQILNAVDTASDTGNSFWVGQAFAGSFVPVCGDITAAGTIQIQCSNDAPNGPPSKFTPTNWANIPNATSTIVAGIGPAIVIPQMCFAYIRAVFTRTSGGTSTVIVNMNVLTG